MMHAVASKRRLINVISLSFVSKLFSKRFLIKSIKMRSDKLGFGMRLNEHVFNFFEITSVPF